LRKLSSQILRVISQLGGLVTQLPRDPVEVAIRVGAGISAHRHRGLVRPSGLTEALLALALAAATLALTLSPLPSALALLALALLTLTLLTLALLALTLLTLALLALTLLTLALLALTLLTLALLTLALLALALLALTLLIELLLLLFLQRRHPADEVRRLLGSSVEAVTLRSLTCRIGRLADALTRVLEVGRDPRLHWIGRIRSTRHGLFGVVDHLLGGLVADGTGGFLKLPRRVTLPTRQRLAPQVVELLLQLRHAVAEAVLLFAELLHLGVARLPRLLAVHVLDARCNVLLLANKIVRLLHGFFCRLLGTLRLVLIEQPLRLLQALCGLTRLGSAIAAIGCRLTHGRCRLLQPPRRIRQILSLFALPLSLTPQLFELPRGLLYLIG
jgi:hypothetical protein